LTYRTHRSGNRVIGGGQDFGGDARAAEVYKGCAVLPTTFKHVWYFDPFNGMTAAEGGDGSQSHPWKSLQAAFAQEKGYATPLLSSVPYRHLNPNPGGNPVWAGPPTGPINPGDKILLMSGNYGDVSIGAWSIGVNNPSFVAIAAAPGETPVLSSLVVTASSRFLFSGLKVVGTADSSPKAPEQLVLIIDQGAALPTSDIVFTNMRISSTDDADGWTKQEWHTRARHEGIFTKSGDHGADTTCISVTNSHIWNVVFGAVLLANKTLFSGNEIDHFGDDGIDYAASDLMITKNYIHDDLDLGIGAHMDGMQGYPGSFTNVVIESNRVIRQTDPKLPFPTYLQGIDAFDGDWANLRVTNNVIVTSSCWGIGFASIHGVKSSTTPLLPTSCFQCPAIASR
jgi:hypothetical protein